MGGLVRDRKAPEMSNSPGRSNKLHAPGRRYAKIAEVARYLHVSDRTVRQMLEDGRLTAHRLGKRVVRIDLNEVDATMASGGAA